MKRLFAKDNFISSSFNKGQRRQSIVVSLLLVISFVLASFAFFHALYPFVDAMGSIVCGSFDVAINDLLRSVPIILVCLMAIWTVLMLQASFRNDSDERRLKSLKKNAIVILVFAAINIVYIVVGRISGRYLSLVEGSPTPIYPLDMMLWTALYVAIAIFVLIYLAKMKDIHPYIVPSRGPAVKKARFAYCFFVGAWLLIALYGLSAFFFGLFIIDFAHGHQFYSILLLVTFFLDFFSLCIWEFYFNNLTSEKKKDLLLPLASIGLVISLAVMVLYFVALGLDLDAPSNIGFGVLPIAFSASLNVGSMILAIAPSVVCLVALIKGVTARKR